MGVKEIALHAQLTAKAFYARLGYREEGEVFEEAGIPHVAHAQDDRMSVRRCRMSGALTLRSDASEFRPSGWIRAG